MLYLPTKLEADAVQALHEAGQNGFMQTLQALRLGVLEMIDDGASEAVIEVAYAETDYLIRELCRQAVKAAEAL